MRHADHSCAYAVYTPSTSHIHLVQLAVCLVYVVCFVVVFSECSRSRLNNRILLHCRITTGGIYVSYVWSFLHRRFLYLCVSCSCIFLSDVASGAALQDCETHVKRLSLLIDGSNQNKHGLSKIPPCCVETTKPPVLISAIAAFLFSLLLRFFVIYPTFIWALCVFGMYTENPSLPPAANIGAQSKKKENREGPRRGEAADDNAGSNRRFELLTAKLQRTQRLGGSFVPNWPRWSQLSRMSLHQSVPLTGSCVFFFFTFNMLCFRKMGGELDCLCIIFYIEICVPVFHLINLASACYPSISAGPSGFKPLFFLI